MNCSRKKIFLLRCVCAVLLQSTACLVRAATPVELLQELDDYPHAQVISSSDEQVLDYELGLGSIKKVRGVWRFKDSERKTGHLQTRPVFVRTEQSTRGHVFVVMLAYLIERELARCWRPLELTVAEGIDELGSLRGTVLSIGPTKCQKVPRPTGRNQQLLDAAQVELPEVLPLRQVEVATRKKLVERRK